MFIPFLRTQFPCPGPCCSSNSNLLSSWHWVQKPWGPSLAPPHSQHTAVSPTLPSILGAGRMGITLGIQGGEGEQSPHHHHEPPLPSATHWSLGLEGESSCVWWHVFSSAPRTHLLHLGTGLCWRLWWLNQPPHWGRTPKICLEACAALLHSLHIFIQIL
jgi:hypothetical protein